MASTRYVPSRRLALAAGLTLAAAAVTTGCGGSGSRLQTLNAESPAPTSTTTTTTLEVTTTAPVPTTTGTPATTAPSSSSTTRAAVTTAPTTVPTTRATTTTTAPKATTTAPAATALSAQVLSTAGPITHMTVGGTQYEPAGVYAGLSLAAVRAAIPATASCSPAPCWAATVAPAVPSLYVAGPLRATGCQKIDSVAIRLTGAKSYTLSSTVSNTCPMGAQAAAISGLTLIAVPLSSLPAHATLMITVDSPNDAVPPASTTVST